MGFLRKAAILGTMGAGRAVIKPNSKKERSANAAEEMLKMQKAEAKRARKAERRAPAPQPRVARGGRTTGEVSPDHICDLCTKKGHDRSYHVPGAYRLPPEPRPAAVKVAPDAGSQLASVDPMEQIAQLAKHRDAGALTEEEFAAKKAEFLGRI